MNTELQVLAASVLLGIVHLLVTAGAITRQRGVAWNIGARDATPPPLTGMAARLNRSWENFKETYPFFVAAILLAHATESVSSLGQIGALAYLGCRVIYIPIYVFGVNGVRSLIWGISLLGIVALVFDAIF